MIDLDSFVPFYFASTMGINLLCAASLLVSGAQSRRSIFKALFIGCILAFIYQYSTWQYHEASSLETSLFWLRWQTSIVVLCIPLFYFIYTEWSRLHTSRFWLLSIGTISLIFFGINTLSEFTLRFSQDPQLIEYTIFTGERVYRTSGMQSNAAIAFQLYVLAIVINLLWLVAKLLQRKDKLMGSILFIALFVQMSSAVISRLVDSGHVHFILLGGLPFTMLNFLVCVATLTSLESKTLSLRRQINKRKNLERVLASMATGVSSSASDTFYVQMMKELAKIGRTSTTYIAVYSVVDKQELIDTKAVISQGQILPNFQFNLASLPPDLVTYEHKTVIKRDLQSRFPTIKFFKHINAHAMISMPITSETSQFKGKLEGSILLYFDRPITRDPTLDQILEIFASRAGAEVQRNRLEQALVTMAYVDYQTKLPNLTKMHELIKESYEANLAQNSQSVLLMIDINKFAQINHQYGFDKAEIAIQKLGKRLLAYCSEDITIARSGGDEFAILIHHAGSDPQVVINTHWDAINALICKPLAVGNRSITLSCSAGGVIFPQQVNKHIEVVRCAETALGQSKQAKHNGLRLFDENILKEIDRKQTLELLLERAIVNDDEIFAVYQPKVDQKGRLVGAEALARWQSPTLGFVSPEEFIAVAESAGLIEEFGHWMVNTVCKQINKWRTLGFVVPNRIAINFSALQLVPDDFVSSLVKTLRAHSIKPSQIEIELTESGLLTNIDGCIVKLHSLREAGFTIALDDFGTGYSSLSYLKDLPLDVLKIDRSFVNDLRAKNTIDLARSIINIGQNMSLRIVAEGVEEVEQVKTLTNMGCEIFQGYYFAKPMTSQDFLVWALDNAEVASSTR